MGVISFIEDVSEAGVKVFRWPGLSLNDTGAPLRMPQGADKTVQVVVASGDGSGLELTMQGSNGKEGASPSFATLHKSDLSVLTFNTAGIFFISENPNLIRPTMTGGVATTVDVIVCIK